MLPTQEASKAAKEAEWQAIQDKAKLRRDPEAWEAEIMKRRNKELAMRQAQASGEPVAVEEKLPEGWAAAADPSSGETYFYNKETKETTWDRPRF